MDMEPMWDKVWYKGLQLSSGLLLSFFNTVLYIHMQAIVPVGHKTFMVVK